MWIPKWQRDQQGGVDSPVPTQVVSNEEFLPRPQSHQQRQWERLPDTPLLAELANSNQNGRTADRPGVSFITPDY